MPIGSYCKRVTRRLSDSAPPQVVPGTSLELFRDEESIAYRVVLIKKYRHRFIDAARVHRYVCREYHYDELEVQRRSLLETVLLRFPLGRCRKRLLQSRS